MYEVFIIGKELCILIIDEFFCNSNCKKEEVMIIWVDNNFEFYEIFVGMYYIDKII